MLSFAKRIVMNKIYISLFMALALSLFALWKSNEQKEKEPFCVTYHVAIHTISLHKTLITYTDSQGLVQEIFKDRHWSKTVSLPPDGIASLYVEELIEAGEIPYSIIEPQDSVSKELGNKPISIWIEHEKKIVLNAGGGQLRVSLLPSEVNGN